MRFCQKVRQLARSSSTGKCEAAKAGAWSALRRFISLDRLDRMANHGFELLRREPALVRQRPVRRGGPPALEGHPRARVPRKGARKPLPSRWRRRSLVGGHASGLFPGAIDGVEGIPNAKPLPSRSRCFQESLIAEAQSEGLSISPDNVLGIAKSADGKIIWIENGNHRR